MGSEVFKKYLQVAVIVVVCVFVDQWTKHVASARLATQRPGDFAHNIVLTVPPEADGMTVREYVAFEFGRWNSSAELNDILRGVTDDGAVLLPESRKLSAGDVVEIRKREVVVIPDHFDFQYTRNRGAAFSFLADTDSPLRVPFFIVVSLLAVIMVLYILYGVRRDQQILVWGLSLVCGGAIGNLIDRIVEGWVVDFIVWKWTDAYRWPTFNMADVFIVVGVSLMLLDMLLDAVRDRSSEPAVDGAD